MRKNIFAVVAVLFVASSSFAALSDVVYFDFSGWDHTMVSTVGQTFTDIIGDVDVTVTTVGDFDSPSSVSVNGMTIRSTHAVPDPGQHSFKFTFSEPLRLVVSTKTVDRSETHSIFGAGPETYFHDSGAAPTVVPNGSGISITGNGFGISPTGAAFGETTTGPSSLLTLTYAATPGSVDKFGQWMVGTFVPEPNSIALLGIGSLGLLLQGRKRRK